MCVSLFKSKPKSFSLETIYGITEVPPENCPTYIERKAHKEFSYAVEHEKLHIVVYGASRQGKSWLIEKYCPKFVRIGCDSKFTRELLFKSILNELNISVGSIQKSTNSETGGEVQGNTKFGVDIPLVVKAEAGVESKLINKETSGDQISYTNIDLTNQSEVLNAIKNVIEDRIIVLENFHYLEPSVQKVFASSLKECLYYPIRVVIVGVWKETTKLVSLASDLTNRIEPIDIGDWSATELAEIVKEGDRALNVVTDENIISLFIDHAGCNVGIFKSLMKNYCKLNNLFFTNESKTIHLNDITKAHEAIEKSYQEVIVPSLDRLRKLASSKKSGGKGLRFYIIKALLGIISSTSIDKITEGIPLSDVVQKIDGFREEKFQPQNIKQELMVLHTREETITPDDDTNMNFIPLFYFDQGKDKVFIVESALIGACKNKKIDLANFLGDKALYVR